MPKLVCVSAASRSSNTFGIAMVVELKMMPPQAVATSMIARMRDIMRVSTCRPIVFELRFTLPGSSTREEKQIPARTQITPGTQNAARQPKLSTSAPVSKAAEARPRLPHRPFQPSRRPRLRKGTSQRFGMGAKILHFARPGFHSFTSKIIGMLETSTLACERGGQRLFNDLSFALGEGSLLRVRGPNGSGKTTLLRALAGLTRPAAGTVRWRGEER